MVFIALPRIIPLANSLPDLLNISAASFIPIVCELNNPCALVMAADALLLLLKAIVTLSPPKVSNEKLADLLFKSILMPKVFDN